MNYIEKLHYDKMTSNECFDLEVYGNVNTIAEFNYQKAASKLAEITENISTEFLDWVGADDYRFEKWATNKVDSKFLFQEFLKTKEL